MFRGGRMTRFNAMHFRVRGSAAGKYGTVVSPAGLVRIIALSIFATEFAVMLVLSALPPVRAWQMDLLDSTLLTLLLSPILYWFLFRPLCIHVEALRQAQAELQQQRDHLDEEVKLRTSELVKANLALEASFAEIDDLYQNAPFGYHSVDRDGLIVKMNDTELSLLGYARDELVGKKRIRDLLAPRSAAAFSSQFSHVKERGWLRDAEAEFIRKDGSAIPVLVNVSAIRDERGEFVKSRASVYDISKRKKAEKEREQYFRFFNTSTDLMGIAGQDGIFKKVNQAFVATLGYPEAELLSKPYLEFIHPDDHQRTLAEVSSRLERGYTLDFENRFLCKDGSVRWLSWSAIVDYDENLIYATARDITKQKQYEQTLFNSNQFLERVFNTTHFSVVYLDRHFNFIRVNQAYADACGHPPEYFPGKNHFQLYPHEENEAIFRNVVETGQVFTVSAKPFAFPDHPEWGITYWDWTLHPLKSPDGSVEALLFVLLDATERKRSEMALSRFAEELEIQVAERTAELAGAKKEAEDANNAKTRFLAAASHDLRQPLSALRLYAGVLKQKAAAEDQAVLVHMDECVASLSDLLSKLLDLSKLEAGVVTPRARDFAVDDMFHKLLAAHAPEAEIKGLHLRCPPTGLTARTDPVLFQRVVGNLLDNAIHYTMRGGVLILCRRHLGRRWVEIWDTGIGIPEDKIGEVFEEFRQLDDEARTRGSGLGLTIVAKTATLLGLEIRVRSRPGRGSMFAIELPPGSGSQPEPRRKVSRGRAGLRVAAVDDNEMTLKALVCAMENAGHKVIAAASGAQLLARLEAIPPDVMICDYRLAEGETGFDVIKTTRAAFGKELPAIILTGDTDPNLMRHMAAQGVAMLHKPVEFDELQARIEETLKGPTRVETSA